MQEPEVSISTGETFDDTFGFYARDGMRASGGCVRTGENRRASGQPA